MSGSRTHKTHVLRFAAPTFACVLMVLWSIPALADRWGAWQSISSSDPHVAIQISFKPPLYPDKKTGDGYWYWRVRNTSDTGVCLRYEIIIERSDNPAYSFTQDGKLKPGQESESGGYWTIGKRIVSTELVWARAVDSNGSCDYSHPPLASRHSSGAGGSRGPDAGAGSGGSPPSDELQNTFVQNGTRYCIPGYTFKSIGCACPYGAGEEIKFPSGDRTCSCDLGRAWNDRTKRCELTSEISFPKKPTKE